MGHEKVLSKLFAVQFKTNTFVVGRTSCMAGYMHEDVSNHYIYFESTGASYHVPICDPLYAHQQVILYFQWGCSE